MIPIVFLESQSGKVSRRKAYAAAFSAKSRFHSLTLRCPRSAELR